MASDSEQTTGRDPGDWPVRAPRRVWPLMLGVVGVVLAIMIAYPVVIGWLLFSGSSPLRADESPPQEYSQMSQASDGSGGEWRSLGGFIDEDFAWHMPMSRARLTSVVATLALEPVALDRVPRQFMDAMPWGWSPGHHVGDLAFQTPGFVADERGEDGTFLFAYWDSQRGEVYVWDKRNF